ncbi:MAG: hypothetical protein ABUT20_58175 [Bacteroidota bacterium]
MTLYKTGWLAIAIEVVLLLIWINSVYFSKNGTDDAGKGLALVYLLALSAYILTGIILMLVNNRYCTIAVLCMAAIPLLVVIYGLFRYYS